MSVHAPPDLKHCAVPQTGVNINLGWVRHVEQRTGKPHTSSCPLGTFLRHMIRKYIVLWFEMNASVENMTKAGISLLFKTPTLSLRVFRFTHQHEGLSGSGDQTDGCLRLNNLLLNDITIINKDLAFGAFCPWRFTQRQLDVEDEVWKRKEEAEDTQPWHQK